MFTSRIFFLEFLIFSLYHLKFEDLMKIKGEPVHLAKRFWEKAIPQYTIGYVEHENYFDHFEKDNRGILLSGNYRGGISVGDCIKNAELVLNKVKSLQRT